MNEKVKKVLSVLLQIVRYICFVVAVIFILFNIVTLFNGGFHVPEVAPNQGFKDVFEKIRTETIIAIIRNIVTPILCLGAFIGLGILRNKFFKKK